MRRMLATTVMILICAAVAHAGEIDITGTYRLVNSERKVIETGEVIRSTDSVGYITYGTDGRMLVLIVRNPRPKPAKVEDLTDAQRAELFKTMTAYGGTYTFDGKQVVHNIDISWNEAWTGTKQPRYVSREGERLVYSTDPYRYSGDGRMVTNRLVWEKAVNPRQTQREATRPRVCSMTRKVRRKIHPNTNAARLRPPSGELIGQFGRHGRQPGQFKWVHNIAIDSKGNLYTAEVGFGRRVQKFKRLN